MQANSASADATMDAQPEAREATRMGVYPYARLEGRPDPTPSDGPDPYGNPDPDWLGVEWSRHLRWVEVEGAVVNVMEIGEGDPILYVHGLAGCWQNWLENILPFVASGHRVVAIDLPGFGQSPMPSWEITIAAYARMLDQLRDELDLEGATLVGNSMGGFIVADLARLRPDWVSRLVLVSAAGISHATNTRGPAQVMGAVMTAIGPVVIRLHEDMVKRPGLRAAAFAPTFHHPGRIPKELLWEFFGEGAAPPGYLAGILALTGYDILDELPEIEVPTLIVWGREDRTVPSADATGYAERVAGAELEVFADCGHIPMAERPLRFNRRLERFIDEHPRPGAEQDAGAAVAQADGAA